MLFLGLFIGPPKGPISTIDGVILTEDSNFIILENGNFLAFD